ncbi:hypothetical protein ACIBHX_45235 [Nonomuraea sp. NPDC050536]|uniref:hypothetical protein n=1 Tax=Nonomuraea sp. NPDC050536 TaxID=3364366 RepID=UPI0037C66BC5
MEEVGQPSRNHRVCTPNPRGRLQHAAATVPVREEGDRQLTYVTVEGGELDHSQASAGEVHA